MAAHVAPEAVRGGPIAALRDGDELTIDADTRRLDVALSRRGDRGARRRLRASRRAPTSTSTSRSSKYAKLVGSAAEGAIAR